MKQKRVRWMLVLAVAVVVGAVAGVASAEEADGQAIFLAQKCEMCHAVSTVGIEAKTKSEAMKGPDLVDLEYEADWLAEYLKKQAELEGAMHKKEFKGSDEELSVLIDWMLAQKTEG